MSFALHVTYNAGNEQAHTGLTDEQVEQGMGAFWRDMISLDGEGVRSFTVELEQASDRRPAPLTDTEKAYFDTIKSVAVGARPSDLVLHRLTLGGKDVAAIMQRVINTTDGTTRGFQPLAIICDDNLSTRLRGVGGDEPESVDPGDVEGAA